MSCAPPLQCLFSTIWDLQMSLCMIFVMVVSDLAETSHRVDIWRAVHWCSTIELVIDLFQQKVMVTQGAEFHCVVKSSFIMLLTRFHLTNKWRWPIEDEAVFSTHIMYKLAFLIRPRLNCMNDTIVNILLWSFFQKWESFSLKCVATDIPNLFNPICSFKDI